ncbi:FAD-dependent oxidoreductase [Lichenihabitans sp. Uapishka_5]|uniref:FAD-dependent oxidoreductase n=1 Tax=Lichenihabitans sp. Uapishka_5 TaxID=3037302 RepID=UPI0029E80546|nr:FAD-dependent oxidoreductase [Lichenihabitans sp. Uapishka_5]MDX7950814.1 FAD-dependent oxidoreductase [Lichenihabitans sp. Uapishka_5]
MLARAGASWRLTLDGVPLSAVPGESVAAALLAAGFMAQGTAKDGSARGAFCGMGVCHDCLLTIDDRAGQRACLTKAHDGMRLSLQPQRPDIGAETLAFLAEAPQSIPDIAVDVLVVGAGPAGLAAAQEAGAAGATVLLIDERPVAGGQYYKQPATGTAAADRQAREGAALIACARAGGVDLLSNGFVWGAEREAAGDLVVGCLVDGGARRIRPRRLIVATGAYEPAPLFPGWTLPGVITAGALQTLLRSDGVVPGARIAVAGNGPLNLQVAVELLRHGVTPVAVIEAAPPPWTRPREAAALFSAGPQLAAAGLRHLQALRRAGVPVLWNSRVVTAAGDGRVSRIVVSAADDAGARDLDVDLVAIGEGFRPAHELPRLLGCRYRADGGGGLALDHDPYGATSQPDILVAGEAGRFGGAVMARQQGTLAGRAAARQLGFPVPADDRPALKRLARAKTFQRHLWALFAAEPPGLSRATANTILCRCEALSRDALELAIAQHGVSDVATLKRLTRAGMGRCQARYCGEALQRLVRTAPDERAGFAPQMPLRPVPLAALALEKPEWGGHKRSLLADWTPPSTPLEPHGDLRADVVVIGAGIAGLSTALFLARAGADVLVLDRAEPNSLASGGNAGSLHGQLLSFDHGARAEAGGGPAARTLPLQNDSIALWGALERELGADFEIKRTGGLMVAETERDLAFLDAKTRVERAQGVRCDVITAADLRRLEPALAGDFIGAAYCPDEGKINPLVATQGILTAALRAGVRIERRAAVTGITQLPDGFEIATSRGSVLGRRIVNAAGAFASTVGRLLGLDVPVHGAPLQMVVTEPAAPALTCLVAHADRHLTLKQAGNGSFLIGGGWTAGLDPVHRHPRPLMASLEGNLWVAQRVLPGLGKLHVVRSWAAMNINIDGAPILGEDPRQPGLFHAVTSNGYTLGPLVGRITADLVTRGVTDRDVSGFSIARFDNRAAA